MDVLTQSRSKTPPNKRLRKEFWGTKEARERKKALAKERQARRRKRLKAEDLVRRRRENSSSDEEEAPQETPLPPDSDEEVDPLRGEGLEQDLENLAPPDRYPDQDRFARERHTTNLTGGENKSSCRELLPAPLDEALQPIVWKDTTSLLQREYKRRQEDALEQLSGEIAKIKVSSNVSDAALDKIIGAVARNREVFGELLDRGVLKPSYTKGMKPHLLQKLPKFNISLLLKVEDSSRGYYYEKIEGLTEIPEDYLKLPANGKKILLRNECSVKVSHIKELFLETHGGRSAANLQHLKNISLSADGVQESKRGSTTFIIVTMRIHRTIYLVHIFDFRIGVAESKPTAVEILR